MPQLEPATRRGPARAARAGAPRSEMAISSSSRFTPVQVVGREAAARNAVTLRLAVPGTRRAPAPYQPGQFITLAFTLPAAKGQQRRTVYRSYSLCGDGNPQEPWQITVKVREGGLISPLLWTRVGLGVQLPASRPQGTFTLPPEVDAATRLVFVAGGSGITPIYGMLRALAALPASQRPRVWLHYAYASTADAIYGRELAALDPEGRWLRQTHYVSSQRQRLTPQAVLASLGPEAREADWYLCGPDGLRREIAEAAARAGVPDGRVHMEVFSSPGAAAAGAGASRSGGAAVGAGKIRVAETGALLDVQGGETLLDALERHGYQPDFSCRAGGCGTCQLRMLAGRVTPEAGDAGHTLTRAERAAGYVLSCSARPVGDVTLSLAGVPAPSPSKRAAVAAQSGTGRRTPAQRQAISRGARWTVAAASLLLFGSVWGATGRRVALSASPLTSAWSSLTSIFAPSSSSTTTSGTSGTSSSSSSSSGSSGTSGSNSGSGSTSGSNSSNNSNGPSWFSGSSSSGSSASTGSGSS